MEDWNVTRLLALTMLIAAILCGCTTTKTAPVSAGTSGTERPRNLAGANAKANERKLLSGYRKERNCDGPAYTRAREYAVSNLESVVSTPTEAGNIEQAANNGRFRISLAEAAAQKKCVDLARKAYSEVVEIFTGAPYAALRKRAANGIDRLGSRPSSPNPTRSDAVAGSQPQ